MDMKKMPKESQIFHHPSGHSHPIFREITERDRKKLNRGTEWNNVKMVYNHLFKHSKPNFQDKTSNGWPIILKNMGWSRGELQELVGQIEEMGIEARVHDSKNYIVVKPDLDSDIVLDWLYETGTEVKEKYKELV